MRMVSIATVRAACLAACLCSMSCLHATQLATRSLSAIYVPPDAAEQRLYISGTTATVPDLKPFTIDHPIVYDLETTCGKAALIESKTYTNTDGDEIRFRTKYNTETGESWKSVVVRPKGEDKYELMRLPDN